MVTRILPAVSDPDAARALATLLDQLPEAEPQPPAVDSTQLLNTLAQTAAESLADLPEAVLVHELIGSLPALELIREVALRFPAVAVILVTRDTSPNLYSAAMDAGARGVVGLPLAYDELAARISAAATWAAGVRSHLGAGPEPFRGPGGTVVAVTGAKGGVGCTLTAVELALAARASGRNAALVDLNLQSGDVASFLDVQFRRSVVDLAGIADLTPRVLQDVVFTHETGLSLLLAPAEGERGEEVDDRAARQIVGAMRARYEVVVVDCGTQMHAANAAAIEMADRAVLLTTPDVVSVRAAKRMVRLWDRLQIRKAEETVTVVNRASKHTEIQPALVARIVGTPVAQAIVPANFKELHTALDAGRIQDVDHRSTVKQALWSLAAELGAAAPLPEGGKGGRGGRGKGRHGKGGKGGDASGDGGGGTGESAGSIGSAARPAALTSGSSSSTSSSASGSGTGSGSGGRGGSDRGAVRLWHRRSWDDRGSVALPGLPAVPVPRGLPAPPGRRGAAPPGGDAATAAGRGAGRTGAGWRTRTDRGSRTAAGRRTAADPRTARDPRTAARGGAGERGALTVEFAGMAPIVLVVLALLWQCVLIGFTFTLAGNAADEGARAAASAAAYGDPGSACESAAREHLPGAWDAEASVSCYQAGGVWKADVDLATPVLFPGAANLPFTVHGSAGAAVEAEAG
ncbi:CpaE family protein [Streptomyces phytohabitans]|uniref:AAA family ATPase n=1 Tax=Streptomyces phytohabitans TaxID=1150371 RepID=UPI00345BC08A